MKDFNIWEYHIAEEAMAQTATAAISAVKTNNRTLYWVVGLLLIGLVSVIGIILYQSLKAFSAKQAKKQLEEQANQGALLHQFEQRLTQQEKKYPTQPQITIPNIVASR